MDIISVMKQFGTQEDCLRYIEKKRWGESVACIYCTSTHVGRKNKHKIESGYNCYECGSSFSIISGTVFHGTKIPLPKWFTAISLVLNSKKSISSPALARLIGVSQKTAWFMLMRLRERMDDSDKGLLRGIVEADETYIGGNPRNKKKKWGTIKRGRGTTKSPVVGMVERGGRVIAEYMKKLGMGNVSSFLLQNIRWKNTTLMTDEYNVYKPTESYLQLKIINHRRKEYVNGDIHTNTIKGFFSLLKRAYNGTHHSYSVTWLPLYLREACYKYNNRNNQNLFFDFLDECIIY